MVGMIVARMANRWDNPLGWRLGRVACHYFRWHYLGCRGRRDHVRDGQIIDPGRWSS